MIRRSAFLRTVLVVAVAAVASITVFATASRAAPMAISPVDQTMPALVYNPHPEVQAFLLLWVEDRASQRDIYVKRLFGNGLPQGGASLRGWRVIPEQTGLGSKTPGPRADPAIVYHPTREEYLLVYSEVADEKNGWDVFSVRISTAGYARGYPRRLVTGPGDQRRPDVALLGDDRTASDDYLVVWEDNTRDIDEVWALRVQANGIPRASPYPLVQAATNARDPTTNGTAVAWVDDRRGQSDLFQMTLRNGLPSGVERAITGDVLEEFNPRYGSGGLVWNVYHPLTGIDVMGVEIIENSTARGTGAILVPAADQVAPDMANGVVVFADNRTGDFDLYAVRAVVRGRARALGHDYLVMTDR